MPGSGAEGRSAGDERGQRFLSAEAAWLLFPLRVPRGLHPTHQVHGHLRDHSTPPLSPRGGCKRGKEARDGAPALTPPVWSPATVRLSLPTPPHPPSLAPAPPGHLRARRCPHHLRGAATAGSCSPQRLAKGPFKRIFSSPRVVENFLPTGTLCKGKKNKKKKSGEWRKMRAESLHPPTFPFLAPPRRRQIPVAPFQPQLGELEQSNHSLSSTNPKIVPTLHTTEFSAGRGEVTLFNKYFFHLPTPPVHPLHRMKATSKVKRRG